MKISIVSTLYRSAPTLDEFHRRAAAAAEQISDDVEFILVNDGSPDDSLERALEIQDDDPRVVVLDLARNFGHHKAMMTGLAHAMGDLVFLLDCDLEEEPELLAQFHEEMVRTKSDVIFGVQSTRRGRLFERLTGAVFFSIVSHLSDEPLPRNVVTARLMVKDYVAALVQHQDREFLIAHLWLITGFRQSSLVIKKHARSPTTYSIRRRLDMAIKHITTTSTRILRYILYSGLLIWGISLLIVLYYVLRYLFGGVGVDGFTSIIVSVWFFGGLLTLISGVIGIYIADILSETKRRPYTIVREVHRLQPQGSGTTDTVPRVAASTLGRANA